MSNGTTSVDHQRRYFDASGVMVTGHGPYRALGDWPCTEADCDATGNRSGRAFCHKFGCNGKPTPTFMTEQARLQRKWDAEQKLRPGTATYAPGAKTKPKAKAAAKSPEAKRIEQLEAEKKQMASKIGELQKISGGSPHTTSVPPEKPAAAKAVKELERKLSQAKEWAVQYPDKGFHKDLIADTEAELELARPQKVVQTSDLQLEVEALAEQIESDKARWQKKKKEEEKLQ